MIDGSGNSSPLSARLAAVSLAIMATVGAEAQAQQATYPGQTQPYPGQAQPYPGSAPAYPTPGYPNSGAAYPSATYPNAGYPAPQSAYPAGYGGYPAAAPVAPESHFFRDLFTGTVAAVLQNMTGGLLGTIAGRIMDWFSHRMPSQAPAYNPAAGYAGANTYPGTNTYPGANTYPGTNTYPNAGTVAANGYPPPATGYPNSGYPATTDPNANAYPATAQAYPPAGNAYPAPNTAYPSAGYPNAGNPGAAAATPGYPPANTAGTMTAYAGAPPGQTYGPPAPQVYDARTGQLLTGAANPYSTRGVGMEHGIYAGIAYEVDAIGTDGHTAPINAATYEFHTGDKFMLYYRPTLPGHMEIYNVNPQGQQTLIDSSNMAAGQMVALGPYQFTNQAGDENLRLVLSPCSTPQLLAATRDIVRMDAPAPAAAASPALRLESCDATASRGIDVHTRDIEKIGVEGTTSFALDPLSGQELAAGKVTPREVSVVFHHR